MKITFPRKFVHSAPSVLSLAVAAALLAIGVAPHAEAAADYWRPLDAGGTWDTTTTNWSTTGNNAGTAAVYVNSAATTPIFGTTTDGALNAYAITLAGNFSITGLVFNTSGYQISAASAQTLTNVGGTTTNGLLTLAAGKTASIGSNVTMNASAATTTSAALYVGAGSTLNIESGASINKTGSTTTGQLSFRNAVEGASNIATVNVAGTVSFAPTASTSQIGIGQGNGTASTSGTMNINVNGGGVISTTSSGSSNGLGSIVLSNNGATANLNVGNGTGTGAVTISSTGAQAGLNVARSGAGWTGTVNLGVGGTLTTPRVFQGAISNASVVTAGSGTGNLNFDGGTLKANVANTAFITGLSAVNIKSGGGTIDNGGFGITISQDLLDGTGGGGVTFSDSGAAATTTLSGSNTYTGTTKISSGTLLLGAAERIANASAVNLDGGTLATGGFTETVGALTLSASSIIDFAGANNLLKFADSHLMTWTPSTTLKIYNYSGTSTELDSDQLFAGTDSSGLTAGQLSSITFYSDAGITTLGTGAFIGSLGQVGFTAVPEPTTVAGGALLLGMVGWSQRRNLRQLVRGVSA